jgi:hypothetical protein
LKFYTPKHNQLYFTMRFIDGLCPDIKCVVLVQRPKNLDTAATLALLQEEVAVASPVTPQRPGDWLSSARSALTVKGTLPLLPPPRQDKAPPTANTRDSSPNDAKLSVINSYCQAMGLCYKCAAP